MPRPLQLICFILLSALLVAQAPTPAPAPLTNADVSTMLGSGISPEIVVAKIRSSSTEFDTSPATLESLKKSSIPDSVVIAMIESSKPQPKEIVAAPPALSEEVLEDRRHKAEICPSCKSIIISYVDPSGSIRHDWLSKDQLKFMEENRKNIESGKTPKKLFYTKYLENVDYVVLWTEAQGYRPYVTYVPHTETETGHVTGNINTYSPSYSWSRFDADVTVNRTYYQQNTSTWSFVDVTATVINAKTGRAVYESWHQGNFRWSKPDKDCLADVLTYLRNLP